MNQRGVVTIEFIFALVVVTGLSAVLFAVTYTLTVVEVTQYVVYSTARAHLAGNKDPETQKTVARAKFKQLTTTQTAIGTLYNGTWFEIVKPDALDIRGGVTSDNRNFSEDLAGGADQSNRNWFLGVSAVLTAKIMNMKLPILGSTNPENEDATFKTRLNAMLIREPTQKECRDFLEKRRSALKQLPSGQKFYQEGAYLPMEDNGC